MWEYGGPEALRVVGLPDPEPGPGEVLTARVALDALAPRPGQIIAVTGTAGAFGGYAIQLAKADGLRVIADAAPADERLVRTLGADEVVARGDDVAERIRALVPDGVPGLADGAVLEERALPAVADGGGLATVRGWSGGAGIWVLYVGALVTVCGGTSLGRKS